MRNFAGFIFVPDTAVTLCVKVGGTEEHKAKGLNTESHCCLFETSVSVTAFVCGPSQHSQKKKVGVNSPWFIFFCSSRFYTEGLGSILYKGILLLNARLWWQKPETKSRLKVFSFVTFKGQFPIYNIF